MTSPLQHLRLDSHARFCALVGVGGIGTGLFFALEGNPTLGRNESRPARLLEGRDYCKLHIISHFVSVLLGAHPTGHPFHVVPIGKVGADAAGNGLRAEMEAAGMDVRGVDRVVGKPTLFSVCFQYPDHAGGNITTCDAAPSLLTVADIDRSEPTFARYGRSAMALAAPEVPLDLRHHLLTVATRHGAFRVASFTPGEIEPALKAGLFALADLVALNEDEAAAIIGMPWDSENSRAFLDACARVLTSIQPGIRILLSAGAHGAYGYDEQQWMYCPAARVEVVSTAGAGDTLLGGVLACLAAGVPFIRPDDPGSAARRSLADTPLTSALEFGVVLAGMSVTSPHTIHPDVRLPTLLPFARTLGLGFGGRLAEVLGVGR